MEISIVQLVGLIIGFLFLVLSIPLSIFTVQQGNIVVITRFGKYKKIGLPGLNFKTPFVDQISKTISIQNRSTELNFQAITSDQANVFFKAMLLYAAQNTLEATILKVAFKFASQNEFDMAITRTIEGSIRSFVATKRQTEVLGLRKEIIEYVKEHLDLTLEE